MSELCGTRSWRDENLPCGIQVGMVVYVPAKYFDSASCSIRYTATLPHQDKAILEGTIENVYSNTIRVKFRIDEEVAVVSKESVMSCVPDSDKKFIIRSRIPSENTPETCEVSLAAETSSDSEFDDSDLDPDYNFAADIRSTTRQRDSDVENESVTLFLGEGNSDYAFVQDEEVILFKDAQLFKAVYTGIVNQCEGRFIIIKVFKKAASWPGFDMDKHTEGAFIQWKFSETMKITSLTEENINAECSTEYQLVTPLPEKKRKRDPSKWAQNVRKRARAHGESYGYITKSKEMRTMPKRNIKASCTTISCRMKCSEKWSESDRKKLFDEFWTLETNNEKRLFLTKYVKEFEVTRKRKRPHCKGKRRDRKFTYKYYFKNTDPCLVEVCQTFFLKTLDISRKQVRTAIAKETPSGTVKNDRRGADVEHVKLGEDKVKNVIEHIQLFKTVESHYVRKNAACQYLPVTLDIATMHRMYTRHCAEKGVDKKDIVTYETYRTILQQNFNIKFQRPAKDRCDTCEAWDNMKDEDKNETVRKEKANHDSEKILSREYKTEVKKTVQTSDTMHAAAFDFQKTLLAPAGSTSSFYYSQRLRLYHLTVTDICNLNSTNCFLWSEEEARKGSNEVSSCLMFYLKELALAGKKKIFLFCDRCVGQNCNRMVFSALALSLTWFGLSSITLNFFVTGHSQNENDTTHSLIEKEARRMNTYTTAQWESVITHALTKNDKKQVKITAITHKDILDFKPTPAMSAFQAIFKQNSKDESGEPIRWSKMMVVEFDEKHPDQLFFKYHYSETNFRKVTLIKSSRHSERFSGCREISDILPRPEAIPKCYKSAPGVSKDKYDALLKLCKKNLIPPQHQEFYKNLKVNDDKKSGEED